MSRCAKCDQEVTSGYVICDRCYERMEGIKEAAIMQEEYQQLVERLRNRSLYKDKATLEIMDLCMEAATVITDLLARTEAAEARAEKAERERDAAVSDLLRAEEAAEETNALLDDEVHPACDYSLYLAVHDSVSDIVNWEHDDVWRGHKEE